MTQNQAQLERLSPQKRALLEKLLARKQAARGADKTMIPKRDPAAPVPLSLAQNRLWITYLLDPESAAYNISKAIQVDEADASGLEAALVTIVNRHEVLRTTFDDGDGMPHQFVGPPDAFRLEVVDLGAMPEDAMRDAVRRLAVEDRRRPFDLRRGPLFRATLARSGRRHYLLVCIHHIIADAWSLGILAHELKRLCREGRIADLPALPIQFGDYAAWQHQWFQGERLERELAYWRNRLAEPSVLQLACDRPRPPRQTFRGAKVPVRIDGGLVRQLETVARDENATLFQALLAAYGALLQRYTRQEDLLVGVPVSTRGHVHLEPLIGFFVNTLPMRLDLSGSPDFRTLVRRTRHVAMEAADHQDLPLEKIVEAVQPQHDPSRSPLFQTLFVLQTAPRSTSPGPGLATMDQVGGTAQFDLSLSLKPLHPGLAGAMEYNSDLFDAATVERLVDHFVFLIETAVAEPDRSLHELPLLRDAERRRIVVAWNDNRLAIPQDQCVHHRVEAQAAVTPQQPAYVFGDEQLTYAQANGKANALAKSLMARGVGRGSFVPVVLARGLAVPVAFLAVMKTGAAMVPMDVRWPGKRLRSVIDSLGAEVVLAAAQGPVAEALDDRSLDVDLDALDLDSENPRSAIEAEDPVYVIFTSGSTGTPKGAMCLHKGIFNRLSWMGRRFCPSPRDIILQTTYHCFDSSFWQLFWPQMHGGCSVLPDRTLGLDPRYGIDLIARQAVTVTDFVPAEFDAIVQVLLEDPDAAIKIRSLRQLIIGGEAINPKAVFAFRQRFPWVEMVNSYGPTETSIGVLSFSIPEEPVQSLPIGRPQENVFSFITDAELRPVPIGVPGELLLGGDCVGGGYVNDAERTDAVFLDSPFPEVCGGKVYRTGDLVRYRADGNIEFLGRIDHQIKIRGYRIEPGEIEAWLLAHPDVREALVMAREDRPGWRQLVAYVTGVGLGPEALRAFVGESLPAYMVPSSMMVLDAMPMTANGKVHRAALPAPVMTDRPDRIAPRTPLEEQITALWCELLELEVVGVNENFFELGGHSLLATRLGFRLRETVEATIPLRDLFEHPTVAEQAELVTDQRTVRDLDRFDDALGEDEEEVVL